MLCRDETVLGARVVELLQTTPLAQSPAAEEAAAMAAYSSSDSGEAAASEHSGQGTDADSSGRLDAHHASSSAAGSHVAGREAAEEELGDEILRDEQLRRLAEVVMGRIDNFDLLPTGFAKTKAQQVSEYHPGFQRVISFGSYLDPIVHLMICGWICRWKSSF